MPPTPSVAPSRPGTSTGAKSVSGDTTSGDGPSSIVALLEGASVGREVGICTYALATAHVGLTQVADGGPGFAKAAHCVGAAGEPAVVLVTDSAYPAEDGVSSRGKGRGRGRTGEGSALVKVVMDTWPDAEVVPVARRYWSEEAGKNFLTQLAVDDEDRPALLVASEQKYLALCATAALFKYLASTHSLLFAPASLKIRWNPLEGTMYMDAETARNLELVHNRVSNKSTQSLFGVLNRTHTPMAARLLRSSLLQPTRVQRTIEDRLDAVNELIAHEDRFERVRTALRPLAKIDFDKLITSLAQQDAETDVARAERRVTQMLALRSVVKGLIVLRRAVQGVQSELLIKIEAILSDDRLEVMDGMIAERLEDDPSAPDKRKSALAQRNAKIWAVRASHSRLLDVARETFKEATQDCLDLVDGYRSVHNLPSLTINFGQNLTMVLNEGDIDPNDGLPDVFKNVSKKGTKKWTCTTLELKKRQQRYFDSQAEIFLLSDQIIQQLVADVLQGVGALYKASEAVAMLDLLWSHAHIASTMSYTRPEFTGTLAIKGGKHPILEKFSGPVVANDVYASKDTSSFQLVQGPNMSGKTTYLGTIALITVQAMIGSFVPAEYASLPLNDCLLTRLSNDDDLAGSLSTFAAEMRATAGILSLATPSSLVLIDELGRGTSPGEGAALAHAVAEALLSSGASCFFATHFRALSATLGGFERVQNLHLQVEEKEKGRGRTHQVRDGVPEEKHYGLEMAEAAGLPEDVLEVAKDVSSSLSSLEEAAKRASRSTLAAQRRRVLLSTRERLSHALGSALAEDDLRAFLAFVQGEAVRELAGGGAAGAE